MATIAPTVIGTAVQATITEATLTASDTFVYTQGAGQMLRLRNTTGGALTVTITGASAVSKTYTPDGGTVNYAAGYSTGSIPATTGDVTIPLDRITAYLVGTLTVTGGTGIKAALVNWA
jgi:hypothetical protein